MNNKAKSEPFNNFLKHIFQDVSAEQMQRSFKQRNIQPAKYAVYEKFILTLIDNVYDTYLGNDCIYRDADIVNHFMWCYNKTASDLKKEGFKFEENKELYDYFLEYFRIGLYLSEESRESDFAYFRSFFHIDTTKVMKNCDMSSFLELYEVFDKTPLRGSNLVTSRR